MPEQGHAPARRDDGSRPWAFSAVLVALAFILRTGRLGDSVWFDELWSTRIKLGDLWDLVVSTLGDYHPPGYALLMFAWIHTFGDSEWSVRMLPLLAGVATVWLTYRIGRLAFDEATGRIGAVLLAVAAAHVWYSQEARAYSLNVCLIALAALALMELRQRPEARAWAALLAVTLAVLPLIHYYNLVVVVLLAWAVRSLPARLRHRLLTAAAGGTIAALAYAGFKQLLGMLPVTSSYLRPFTPFEAWQLLFSWFLTGDGLRWFLPENTTGRVVTIALQVTAAVLFCLGVGRAASRQRHDGRLVVLLFAAFPACLMALWLSGLEKTYIERSALPAIPFFLLLVAAGIPERSRYLRGATVVLLVALQATGLFALARHPDQWTIYKPHEAWRELADWLGPRSGVATGQTVLLASDPAISLLYYGSEFAERIDFATKLRDKSAAITERLGRLGISTVPGLSWLAQGAERAEARSREASVLIIDAPLIARTLSGLLSGELVTNVMVVDVGGGDLSSRAMTLLGASPRFRETGHHVVRSLEVRVFEPAAPAGR